MASLIRLTATLALLGAGIAMIAPLHIRASDPVTIVKDC